MTGPAESLLRVERLRTEFRLPDGRHAAAVDEVSFSIGRGETLGLVGESGSGKSVTALSIVRLVPPPGRIVRGRVELEGRNLLEIDERDMPQIRGRRIGFIFQEPMAALNPVYTIGYQIEETLAVHDLARGAAARRRALELLDAARIPEPQRRAKEYPHQLSGGLRQRAMIALAIAADPALLIADEPTTALDVTVQAEILVLLRDMRRQFHLSLLLITHDFGVIAEMVDRVAVMRRPHCRAGASRIFQSPAHPSRGTSRVYAAIGGLAGSQTDAAPTDGNRRRRQARRGDGPRRRSAPPGCVRARCGTFDPCARRRRRRPGGARPDGAVFPARRHSAPMNPLLTVRHLVKEFPRRGRLFRADGSVGGR